MGKLADYLAQVKTEFKQVEWPGRRQLVRLSLAVILVSGLVGLVLGSADAFLVKIFSWLLP